MKKMLFLTLSLLFLVILSFNSCEKDNACDPYELPISKIRGDTISFDKADYVVFQSKLASKIIFFSIEVIGESWELLDCKKQMSYIRRILNIPASCFRTPIIKMSE